MTGRSRGALVGLALAAGVAAVVSGRGHDGAAGRPVTAAAPHAHGEPCALFAPGTPWEVVQRVTQDLMAQAVTPRFVAISGGGVGTPWFAANQPGTLKYSFVPDGLFIPSGFSGDTTGFSNLYARMNAIFGSPSVWKPLFAQCFQRWSQITGIQYTEVTDDGATWGSTGGSTRGDVRIAMRNIDGPLGILAYNNYPTNGDMVIDSSEAWGSSAQNYVYLRNTVMHEHGHGLGLMHVCPVDGTKLMEPFLNTGFDGPQHDDIRGGQYLYGDGYEPNPTPSSPRLLGFIPQGGAVAINPASLRDSSDVDVYSFTVSANSRITASLAPIGQTYIQGPQNTDGSCGTTSSFDSLGIANLQLSLLNGAQATLVTADATGFRGTESIVNYLVGSAGFYYIRVSQTQMTGTAQLYSLNLSVRSAAAPCPADVTGDGQVNSADLGTLLGAWGQHGGPSDVNGDGIVNSGDLGAMLGAWGACP